MAYCALEDLVERYGDVEIRAHATDPHTHEINTGKVSRACIDATDTIDMYIGDKLDPEATEPPAIITGIACDIARYYLQDDNPLDIVKERYDEAMRKLRDIQAGRASLPYVAGETTQAQVSTVKSADDRVFSSSVLGDYCG